MRARYGGIIGICCFMTAYATLSLREKIAWTRLHREARNDDFKLSYPDDFERFRDGFTQTSPPLNEAVRKYLSQRNGNGFTPEVVSISKGLLEMRNILEWLLAMYSKCKGFAQMFFAQDFPYEAFHILRTSSSKPEGIDEESLREFVKEVTKPRKENKTPQEMFSENGYVKGAIAKAIEEVNSAIKLIEMETAHLIRCSEELAEEMGGTVQSNELLKAEDELYDVVVDSLYGGEESESHGTPDVKAGGKVSTEIEVDKFKNQTLSVIEKHFKNLAGLTGVSARKACEGEGSIAPVCGNAALKEKMDDIVVVISNLRNYTEKLQQNYIRIECENKLARGGMPRDLLQSLREFVLYGEILDRMVEKEFDFSLLSYHRMIRNMPRMFSEQNNKKKYAEILKIRKNSASKRHTEEKVETPDNSAAKPLHLKYQCMEELGGASLKTGHEFVERLIKSEVSVPIPIGAYLVKQISDELLRHYESLGGSSQANMLKAYQWLFRAYVRMVHAADTNVPVDLLISCMFSQVEGIELTLANGMEVSAVACLALLLEEHGTKVPESAEGYSYKFSKDEIEDITKLRNEGADFLKSEFAMGVCFDCRREAQDMD